MYIENIVIGYPIVKEELIFGNDDPKTWEEERKKTVWTNERFLPKIIGGEIIGRFYGEEEDHPIKLGIALSISEVRRNRKDLCVILGLDYLEIKYGRRRLFVLSGLDENEEYIDNCEEVV